MLALTRFRPPASDVEGVAAPLLVVRDLLRARPGVVDVTVGRSMDDPGLWTLTSRWADVRSYRWALGDPEVKVAMAAVMAWVLDEPGSYEIVGDGTPIARAADAGDVGLGEAAAPHVATDRPAPR